jgi:hypothetical protein
MTKFGVRSYFQHIVELRLSSAMTHGQGRIVRDKLEVLTASYPIKVPEKGQKK